MLDEKFIFLGVLINFIGSLSYLRSTLKGETKPNKVTWFLWAIVPMIAFNAQLKQNVGLLALPTFMAGFNPALIFIASFINKKAKWQIGKTDIACGILSVIGIILWLSTNNPNLAILFAILADGLAATPTIIKSYKFPETENAAAFVVAASSAIIALLTVKSWKFENVAFLIYIIVICTILSLLIHFQLGRKIQKLNT